MMDLNNVKKNRWFMGKNKTILSIKIFDELSINENTLAMVSVKFTDNTLDYYLLFENEKFLGDFLKVVYSQKNNVYKTSHGEFQFLSFSNFNNLELASLAPLNLEQSNSSFVAPQKFFFKLYRRLQVGIHPEVEVIGHLNQKKFKSVPNLLGSICYKANTGELWTLGILENHIENTQNAWDFFCGDSSDMQKKIFAENLGKITAQMHYFLKSLKGNFFNCEENSLCKLKKLLANSCGKKYSDTIKEWREKIIDVIPILQKKLESLDSKFNAMPIQRVHGDFHLGQILIQNNSECQLNFGVKPNLYVIDFEGEPAKPLIERKSIQPVSRDLASMIRSFQYADAITNFSSQDFQNAFICKYCNELQLNVEQVLKEIQIDILKKTIDEACYELEFRPDWFWIPANALLKFAYPGE